jgi:uncharacterized integral membrane protein
MFALILIVIIGLGIALFAQQNTASVPVTLASYSFPAVPVYLVVISSLLFGLIIAWILSVMNFFSHTLHLRRKDSVIHDTSKRVSDLEEEVHRLETENAELRGNVKEDHSHRPAVHDVENPRKGFFEQMKERIAHERREGALS